MRAISVLVTTAGLIASVVFGFTRVPVPPPEHRGSREPSAAPPVPIAPKLRADSRTVVPPKAHLVALPVGFDSPTVSAENPALESALDAEPDDPARAARVYEDAMAALAADPELEVYDVRCTPTFCRLRMTKPIESVLGWAEVDRLLAPIAQGETIFTARPEGDVSSTAHVYFSAPDAALPLDQVHPASVRPGV